jgi:hypothetical protein
MILDGRNRARACEAAEVDPIYAPFRGDDPAAFVSGKNLRPRHLNESQRGIQPIIGTVLGNEPFVLI